MIRAAGGRLTVGLTFLLDEVRRMHAGGVNSLRAGRIRGAAVLVPESIAK